MRLIDYISLGFKNTWRRKSRSFLTIFAVVIGAVAILIMFSLVLGAKQVATSQIESIGGLTLVSISANPQVQSSGNLLNNWDNGEFGILNDTTLAQIKSLSNIVGATPTLGIGAKTLQLSGSDKRYRASVLAYDPDAGVITLQPQVGRALKKGDMDKIVIGKEVLTEYGYLNNPQDIIGKNLTLYTYNFIDWGPIPPQPPENADKSYWDHYQNAPHPVQAEIVGVITSGMDEGQNYITLDWGRRFMNSVRWEENPQRKEYQRMREELNSEINEQLKKSTLVDYSQKYVEQLVNEKMQEKGYLNESSIAQWNLTRDDEFKRSGYGVIVAKVDKTENIESVEKNVKSLGYGITTAKMMLEEIKKIFAMVGLLIGGIGGLVLFVAALGIINNMIMATYERTREIGILRSCGATKGNIRKMFIFEAATIGFLGGVLGLLISLGLSSILNGLVNGIASDNGLPIRNLITFQPFLFVIVIVVTTFIGILAGVFPAIRAARLNPIEALRYE